MSKISFFAKLTIQTMGKLCQRRMLLAGLTLLCLLLIFGIGPAARAVLSEGVSFSGITLAVTAPEGDPIPELLEQYMGKMSDISRYCTFRAMGETEAAAALEQGDVTAILSLPEGFVQGVIYGSNPDVTLIVPAERPLESLLTLWVGQSAADLLSSVQSGVYAVLELYDLAAPAELTYEQVRMDINLRYVNWVLDRQDLFSTHQVSATQALPVALHYRLSLLAYLGLTAAPLFACLYEEKQIAFRRRMRCVGYGSMSVFFSDWIACTAVVFLLTVLPVVLLSGAPVLMGLGAAVCFALFCALFGLFCCQLTSGAAGCGALSFLLALVFTITAGGVLPPALLPQRLREVSWLSPATWLRALLAGPAGYECPARVLLAMAVASLVMAAATAMLYHRRINGRGEAG